MNKEIKNMLVEEFLRYQSKLNGQKASKINHIREDAFDVLKILDLPTRKNENWRFTNVGWLNEHSFNVINDNPDKDLTENDIEPFTIKDLNENLLVFVNGVYSEKLSRIKYPRDEIIIESFNDAEKRNAPNLLKHFSLLTDYKKDFFTAMNTAFARDGVYVNVPAGVFINEPIHIMFITDTRKGPVLSNPRNLFLIGKCSQISVVETYHTIGDNPAFTNMVTEIFMNFATHFEFNKIQNDKGNSYYIGTTHVEQEKNSSFNSSTISMSGNFIRNNLNSVFKEENAEANLNGFYFMRNHDFIDNHTIIDHAVPNCTSNEFYKGILDESARAVFNGKVIVRPNAQKTNAYQTNKNILLTDEAKINTKPELEIFADDVKCSHGATTGYLDKEAMFYLRSRGISEVMAKSLLLNSFASDVIERIKISELRDDIKRQVADRLTVDDIYFCDVLGDVFKAVKSV
ncbi:MAG: Fe-S cluster assembly protein SufD [bacterium]